MARTALLFLLPAFLVATHWARLEHTDGSRGRFLWMAALALAPALVRPLWARALALAAAGAVAARLAYGTSIGDARPFRDEDFFGPFTSGLWRGFEDFFEVALPFRPAEHPEMHGAILLAVFAFCAVLALGIAARRPLLASAALIAGAGWPATILAGRAEAERGALILGAALLLFVGMRSLPTRDLRQPVVAGLAVVLGALLVSTSPSVARGEFIEGWRTWDMSRGDGPTVGVEYVWNANYRGIRFPKKPTVVLAIEAEQQAGVYWRATTLDLFSNGHWSEQLFGGAEPVVRDGVEDLTDDPFLPPAARNPENWLRANVQVEGLRDRHLIGAGVPVAYDPGDRDVNYFLGNVAIATEGTTRGDSYTVWSYAPKPSPDQLGRSEPDYPDHVRNELFLSLEGSPTLPSFGEPGREGRMQQLFERNPRLQEYQGLYAQARDLVGNPRTPYAAVVAIEAWFRGGGDFVYDEQPPRRRGVPALVSFTLDTKRGYCQHFAGAMAIMLRQLGIPARVAAGFTSGRYENGRWVVADRNAHTWVEAWFDGYGWLPFDPTPGRGQLGATYSAASLRFDVDAFRRLVGDDVVEGSPLLRGETGGPDQTRATASVQASPRGGGADGTGVGIVPLLLLLALGAALVLVAAKLARRASRFLARDPRAVAGACRRDLAGFVVDQGVSVPGSATNAEVGRIVTERFGVDARPLVDALTLARFGPPESASAGAARARRELRRLRKALRARLSVPRRARGLLSVRSLSV